MTEFISLYTWCKENKKEWLVEQWDYKKNYPLTPKDISFGSTKAVAWIYEYVDDKSVFTFQWTNSPNRRTIAATRSDNVCPFINGNVLYRGFNDLQTRNPSLAKLWHPKKNGKDKSIENQYPHLCQEWHPTFNGNLKPAMFSPSSSRRVWWKCLKCGHEWEATISNRTTGGSQCPVCSAKTRGQKQNKVIMCRETGKVFIGTKEVAEEFGVSKQYVSSCCRTHKPLLKKYHLIYINDIHDYHKRIAAQKSSSLFDKD